jgi:hypothetical protein
VVQLDMSVPFTAARGRNAGYAQLASSGAAEFVHFCDGDCTLLGSWLKAGLAAHLADPGLGVVFGRLRERYPERSLYNRIIDWEWDMPVGEAQVFGGVILMRRVAFDSIGGYTPGLIAGEDDDCAQRLRARGWRVQRLDADMGFHDVNMMRFSQWWKRSVRAGHATAQVGRLFPEHYRPQRLRIFFWALVLPLVAVLAAVAVSPWMILPILGLYGLSFGRMVSRFLKRGSPMSDAVGLAGLVTLSKFPNLQGFALFWWRRFRHVPHTLIEYK